jgi:hypothetical protein
MSTTMWISRARLPAMVTWPTPLTVWIERDTCLSASSVSVRRLIESDDTISDITGSASGSTLVITGGSSSGGTLLIAPATFSRTSLTASFRSRSSTNRTVMLPLPSLMRAGNLVDARDAADRLLHRLDHRRRDLVGAGAGQRQVDVHRRRVGARKQVDAQLAERKDPQHHERHDEHRREHRTADAQFRQHA